MDPALLPAAESLRYCQQRTLPYWEAVLRPGIAAGRRLLVASHGNTLRGLIMHLDGISPEAMEHVEVPSGVPLVYRFAEDMTVLGREWLEPGPEEGS
jgi:2,3-bisphosphoglycerate-dependent phosphoglycerate mutase